MKRPTAATLRDPGKLQAFIVNCCLQEIRTFDEISRATGDERRRWNKIRRETGSLPTKKTARKLLQTVAALMAGSGSGELLTSEESELVARVRAVVEND